MTRSFSERTLASPPLGPGPEQFGEMVTGQELTAGDLTIRMEGGRIVVLASGGPGGQGRKITLWPRGMFKVRYLASIPLDFSLHVSATAPTVPAPRDAAPLLRLGPGGDYRRDVNDI